jgi:hypothetical protein
MVNSEELTGSTECLTLYARCCINRCRYNRVPLYLFFLAHFPTKHHQRKLFGLNAYDADRERCCERLAKVKGGPTN